MAFWPSTLQMGAGSCRCCCFPVQVAGLCVKMDVSPKKMACDRRTGVQSWASPDVGTVKSSSKDYLPHFVKSAPEQVPYYTTDTELGPSVSVDFPLVATCFTSERKSQKRNTQADFECFGGVVDLVILHIPQQAIKAKELRIILRLYCRQNLQSSTIQ